MIEKDDLRKIVQDSIDIWNSQGMVIHITEITDDTPLLGSGIIDSMLTLELICDIEMIFNIEFETEIDRSLVFKTFKSLYDYVNSLYLKK